MIIPPVTEEDPYDPENPNDSSGIQYPGDEDVDIPDLENPGSIPDEEDYFNPEDFWDN